MIVGISLPLYSVAFGPDRTLPFNWLDYLAAFLGLLGIFCAFIADNQLRDFMLSNQKAREEGRPI